MAAKVGKSTVEAVKIGPYVDRLCRRLEFSARDRLVTISAAFLLDISSLYFESDSQLDRETALFKLQAVAGDDLVYPPSVLAVTRHMYLDLSRLPPSKARSADVRTGNILTIVDYCFKHFAADVRLLAHRHDTIEQNLRVQVGTLFLPDVTEAFLELLRDDIVYSADKRALCHVLILDELNMVASELTKRVRSGWFECTVSESVGDFLLRSRRLKPDFLVIAARGDSEEVQRLVENLAAQGLAINEVRAFVVHESDDNSHVSPLLRLGVYDVIRFTGDCEILLVKMQRLLAEREEESRRRLRELQDLGSRGSLGDMNVIDLLQAMGPSDKTLRISITAHGSQMTMFLNKGKLLFAECEGKTGAEAVIESLTWSSGIWSVDQVDVSDLPDPNVQRSIDSILMEGCYRLDELKHERAAPKKTQESSPIS
jgi:DNA-binding transcriptional MerR regulator